MPTVPAPPSRHAPGARRRGADRGGGRDPAICHGMSCSVMGPVSAPVLRQASQPPCRPTVPDAPVADGGSPRAHIARPLARACACACAPARRRSHPHRRPGPRLSPPPSGEAGAQPRSWRQFQRLSLLSTGCGGGASQGWAPDRGPGRRLEACVAKSPDRDVCMRSRRRGGRKRHAHIPSCPDLFRASPSGPLRRRKWMAGTSPAMTKERRPGRRWRRAPGGGRGPLAMCHELSCFVMRAAGNVMVRHGPPAPSPSFVCEGGPGRKGRFRAPVRIPHAAPPSRSVPFRSRRRRPGRGGTLFRAYRVRACARARAGVPRRRGSRA